MTMNAVVQESFGGPEVLRLAELDTPRPLGNEVLVQVRAAGVNPVDWKTRAGGGVLDRFPIILGWDLSGLVVETGGGVTRFEPGDEVFGMPLFPRQAGAYAEFVAAPSRQLALKPAGLSHLEAGGLSLAGLTAWQIIDEVANVQAEQRVLVNAACGGVGHLAVQTRRRGGRS